METSDIISLSSIFVSAFVAALAIIVSYLSNNRNLKEGLKKEERQELIKILDEFYGPYQQLIETSKQLSNKLRDNKPPEWRTLTSLLQGHPLQGNDKILFEQIMVVTDQLEELRVMHGRLVDDNNLRILLAKANAHFRILKSAYNNEIIGEPERFSDFVYPRELNTSIDNKIVEIKTKIKQLRGR